MCAEPPPRFDRNFDSERGAVCFVLLQGYNALEDFKNRLEGAFDVVALHLACVD